jgi:hypothetical protein
VRFNTEFEALVFPKSLTRSGIQVTVGDRTRGRAAATLDTSLPETHGGNHGWRCG